jgi:hypothetical protein
MKGNSNMIYTHMTRDKKIVQVVNPDAILIEIDNDSRTIKYYARNTAITVTQKKNEKGEYEDTAIYISTW